MAEEDPYNFEIAIPAVTAGGGRAPAVGYGRYGASSSGEEENSDDGSSPDVSDPDDEEEEMEDLKLRGKRSSKAVETKPAARAVSITGGGSSALDKAKDFLSKYSSRPVETKTTASASAAARRSRVELSMDDDDVSLDSSRDVSRRADEHEHEHDASSYFEDESPVKTRTGAATKPVRDDDDDGREDDYDEESDAPPPYSAPPAPAAISTPAFASTGAWQATPTVSSVQVDDEQQSEEAESVASLSEILESQDQSDYHYEMPPAAASQVTRASAAQPSAPSESGVYEEEAFEEESVQASPDARPAVRSVHVEPTQVTVTATAATSEPAFDYSIDFSDDGDEKQSEAKRVVAAPVLRAEHVQSRHHGSSDDDDNSDGERSALLESDSNSQGSQHLDEPPLASSYPALVSTIALPSSNEPCNEVTDEQVFAPSIAADPERVPVTATEAARGAEIEFEQHEDNSMPAFARSAIRRDEEAERETLAGPVPTRTQVESQERPASTGKVAAAPSDIGIDKQTARLQPYTDHPRPRVVIVRAYETPEAGKPEMKDASTQFTGNHAGIQTELVPDGMHNLQASQRSTPAVFEVQEKRREALDTTAEPAASPSYPEARPTVPTASSVPQPSYSLEMLQQPLAASTSLYKQQLMALQEQILAKKRETERLVSERMSFQYGSLRGTERFIADRRPPTLQLWEALMRVDPTLSEKKAKEAARLAQGGFTA